MSGARYLRDGKIIEIAPGGQLLEKAEPLEFLPGFAFEGKIAFLKQVEYFTELLLSE